jgi:AraC family transcriptional regulator
VVLKLPPGSFLGRTQATRWVPDITVLESVYSPEHSLPPHEHAAAFFDLVVDGTCSEVVGGQRRDRGRSTLAFHPAGEVHSSHWHGPEPRCFHIEIAAALLERVRQYSPILDHPHSFSERAPSLLATRLYHEFRRMDELSPLAIEGLTLELLAETVRLASCIPERKAPGWLLKVRDLLHEKFAEHLTLDEIAESPGVHPAHLARVFRQIHGCTLGDYVRKLRIEFACRLLTTEDTPLVEIALAAGFSDQSHFSKTFRRHMGISPAEFKKSYSRRKAAANECSAGTRS